MSRASLKVADVDLSALARDILEGFRAAEPEPDVELVVADGLRATADSALVRILLEKLLENAWKYTSHHARARIELGREGTGPDAPS